jgi:hypothetical protein
MHISGSGSGKLTNSKEERVTFPSAQDPWLMKKGTFTEAKAM